MTHDRTETGESGELGYDPDSREAVIREFVEGLKAFIAVEVSGEEHPIDPKKEIEHLKQVAAENEITVAEILGLFWPEGQDSESWQDPDESEVSRTFADSSNVLPFRLGRRDGLVSDEPGTKAQLRLTSQAAMEEALAKEQREEERICSLVLESRVC